MFENEAPTDTKLMQRDAPEPDPARSALVQRVLKDIATARKHWEPDFKRMRRNMKFAGGKQWDNQTEEDGRFRVNLIQRVLKVLVASLYAKNPTVIHKRRPTLDFQIWDGNPATLLEAQQAIAAASQMMTGDAGMAAAASDPQGFAQAQAALAPAMQLIADVQQGMERRKMLDRIGKTLVTVCQYYIGEAEPSFKTQMKQMLRRTRTTAVGYVKLGFQREMDVSKDQQAKVDQMSERLAVIARLQADIADGEVDPYCAEAEELRASIAALQSQPDVIVREGLVFTFPGSTKLIPSTSTEKLMGWVGCEWIAEEIMLTTDRIKEVYNVDVGKSYKGYRTVEGSPEGGEVKPTTAKDGLARVYEVYDKRTGLKYVVCEGYPDFLQEPAAPEIFIEQFFPYFALSFNDVEDEGRLFPDSDVENLTHVQKEINRSKEALRQHRIANRPLYAAPVGAFQESEAKTLSHHPSHHVIELQGLDKGRPVSDLLQAVPKVGIDPNVYETAQLFDDMQRVTGNAEANLGGTSNATATESSIAESSRQGSMGLDGDDLDDMLTALFRAAGGVLLAELSEKTAKEIAGIGAVWPTLSRREIARELWLEIKGGSSGRPNAERDAAKFERVAPFVMQVPGINPQWLAERVIKLVDDDTDLEDAIIAGLPSITAMNSRTQVNQSAEDPNAQGDKGGEGPNGKGPEGGRSRDQGQAAHNSSPEQ